MPKRFTDSEKWKKQFIKSMPSAYKLLWIYICDDCDHAGIWQVDMEVAELRTGENLDINEAIKIFGDKIKVFDGGEKWFIPGFIDFQYGELNEKNRAHESVIKKLNKYKLLEIEKLSPLQAPYEGAKDKDKEMDKEEDFGKSENLLIPKMQKAWKDKNKNYPIDKVKDFPALLSIAKFICTQSNIRFNSSDKVCFDTILTAWEHLCDHIPKDKFFKNYSIQQVEKHIQSIVLSIQNAGNSNNGKSNRGPSGKELNEAHSKYFG